MKIKNVLKIDCKNKDLIRAWNEISPNDKIYKETVIDIKADKYNNHTIHFNDRDYFMWFDVIERRIIKKLTDMEIEFKIHYWDYNGTTKINVLLTDSWNSVPRDNLLGALFEVYILIRKENKWK